MHRLKNFFQKIDKALFAQGVLVVIFLAACIWIAVQPNPFDPAQVPHQTSGPVAPPNPTQIALRETEYQLEVEANRDQTVGILIGGSMLVVIVIGSTLLIMNRK